MNTGLQLSARKGAQQGYSISTSSNFPFVTIIEMAMTEIITSIIWPIIMLQSTNQYTKYGTTARLHLLKLGLLLQYRLFGLLC